MAVSGTLRLLTLAAIPVLFAACEAQFDPNQGRKYPCDPSSESAAQCPGGFVCGLEGFCRDRNERGDWLCQSDSDCPALEGESWHCGHPAGFDNPMRCYDRSDAGTVWCRYDAGSEDCAEGWRCGVEGRCHDQTPRAYGCNSDSDCAGGWRCSFDGTCHDTAAEGLREPLPIQRLVRERLNPELPSNPDDFSVNSDFYPGYERYSAVEDGGVSFTRLIRTGTTLDDGGIAFAIRSDVSVLPSPSAVATRYGPKNGDGVLTWVVSGDLLKDVTPALEEGGKVRTLGQVPEGAQLRYFDRLNSNQEILFAFAGNEYAAYDITADRVSPIQTLSVSGAPASFRDVTDLEIGGYQSCDGTYCHPIALATTSAGLFYAPSGSTSWLDEAGKPSSVPRFVPVHHAGLSNSACGDTAPNLGRIRAIADEVAIERLDTTDAPEILLLQWPDGAVPPAASCGDMGIEQATSCPACPSGARMDDFTLSWAQDENGEWIFAPVARCTLVTEDGGSTSGTWGSIRTSTGGCSLVEAPSSLPAVALRAPSSTPDTLDFIDRAGRPYVCGEGNGVDTFDPSECHPLMLTKAPPALMGDPASHWFMALDSEVQDGGYVTRAWRHEPSVGMVPAEREESFCLDDEHLLASVRGNPQYVFERDPANGDVVLRHAEDLDEPATVDWWDDCHDKLKPQLARLQAASSVDWSWPERPELFSYLASTPDGGTALLAAAGDRVWAGEVSNLEAPDAPAIIPVRAVPLPFARISSVTVLDHGEGSEYLRGYLLVNQRLFELVAATKERFDTREIVVPEELVAVFSDGEHGRVGTRGGNVFSLPVPVRIGQGPLAEDDPAAQDFASLNGDTFAVGVHGLYRLEKIEGSPVGVWRKLELQKWLPDDSAVASFEGARFYPLRDGLAVVTAHGVMYRLTYSPPSGE